MAKHIGYDSSPSDSFILRVRRKNRVYGEHVLWPQTVEALQWAIERRRSLGDISDFTLLVSAHGLPLFHTTSGGNSGQRIKNIWDN